MAIYSGVLIEARKPPLRSAAIVPLGLIGIFGAAIPQVKTWGYLPMSLRDEQQCNAANAKAIVRDVSTSSSNCL